MIMIMKCISVKNAKVLMFLIWLFNFVVVFRMRAAKLDVFCQLWLLLKE